MKPVIDTKNAKQSVSDLYAFPNNSTQITRSSKMKTETADTPVSWVADVTSKAESVSQVSKR